MRRAVSRLALARAILLPLTLIVLAPDRAARGAEGDDAPFRASFEAWGYATTLKRVPKSLLNPQNHVAALPGERLRADLRLELRKDFGAFDLFIAPRLLEEVVHLDGEGVSTKGRLRLSQGFARRKSGGDTLLIGRERLTWGPANFRSPSNPYYFDPGRTDPLALVPGIDLMRYTHGIGSHRLTAGYVAGTREVDTAGPDRQSVFLKFDHQGAEHLLSLILMRPIEKGEGEDTAPFAGAFAQYTLDDAWLIYGEVGSRRPAYRLRPGENVVGIYVPGKRRTDWLLGASYIQTSGRIVFAEYLHSEGGFSASERRAYFDAATQAGQLAASDPAMARNLIGQLLAYPLRLFGRNYFWLGWQSNPQESDHSWRVELTLNANDGSGATLLYGEKSLTPKVSGFIALTKHFGGKRTEYGALIDTQLSAGIKWFAF
ncbi:MAG: hypothetical protein LBF93_05885 [Zoogloeaceae bacterium]|jgi:hypothetical protein|nr:hypothetical protein [Zoogloeaceae bacterium]